jgi:hypothetical protein
MDIQSVNISPRVMVLLGLVFASSEIAQAQTVVFKQPPVASQSCAFDTKALLAKILELKNVNAQLANRAMALEGQVAAMKVVSVKKTRTTQYCKRWKHHKCTWLVRR